MMIQHTHIHKHIHTHNRLLKKVWHFNDFKVSRMDRQVYSVMISDKAEKKIM